MEVVSPLSLVPILIGIIFVVGVVLILILIGVFRKRNSQKTTNHNIPAANISHATEKSFKRCPVCQSTYTDESLKYCLSDGAILEGTDGSSTETETVVRQFK